MLFKVKLPKHSGSKKIDELEFLSTGTTENKKTNHWREYSQKTYLINNR